jgi:putative transposase
MEQDTVFQLENQPRSIVEDPLTEILRKGARKLIEHAIDAELEHLLETTRFLRDEQGRRRVVRNGHLPERDVQTGIGAVTVKVPRVRDRSPSKESRIGFSSSILPPYVRKSKSLEALIPWLYLKGVSTGDFSDALAALLGRDAPGLSPTARRILLGAHPNPLYLA